MRIAIMGMGGVGGYLGGVLAKSGHDVSFIARGAHLDAIKANGLKIDSVESGSYVAHARVATDDAREIGPVDAVIVAVKGYSLEEAAKAIAPVVGDDTLVLPLLNGVGMGEKLAALLGKGQVLDGCIYIVSMIEAPGAIKQFGVKVRVIMGCHDRPVDDVKMHRLADCLKEAGVTVECGGDVQRGIWNKYTFICAFAGITSYYGVNAGELRADPAKLEDFKAVCAEIVAIAREKGVNAQGLYENATNEVMVIDPATTSSLQRDCAVAGKPNESEQFCAQVVRMGLQYGVPTPVSERVAKSIKERFC